MTEALRCSQIKKAKKALLLESSTEIIVRKQAQVKSSKGSKERQTNITTGKNNPKGARQKPVRQNT